MAGKKYLLIAKNAVAARQFAELNHIKPAEYKYAGSAPSLDGIHDLTAIFLEGWREKRDHFEIVQAVNLAEVCGVRILHARPDQVLQL